MKKKSKDTKFVLHKLVSEVRNKNNPITTAKAKKVNSFLNPGYLNQGEKGNKPYV